MTVNPPHFQLPAKGYSWVGSGSDTQDTVEACFGPRLYPGHVGTVGFNYDFLGGTDVPATLGQIGHTMMSGPVTRFNWSFYGPWTTQQLSRWAISSGSLATFTLSGSSLLITGTRGGAKSYPTTSTNFTDNNNLYDVGSDDWYRQRSFAALPAITGGVVGFGLRDLVSGEYVALEYDGTTLTCRGKKASGLMAADGFTAAVSAASAIWLQIYYTQSTNTIAWMYSTDQTTWTTIKTQTVATFTRTGFPAFVAEQYWCSLDTNATAQQAFIGNDNAADTQTIPRFGNFVEWAHPDENFRVCHLQEPTVALGDFCESGSPFGLAGQTGYDPTSGPIDHVHFHCERTPNNKFFYTRSELTNMTVAGCLPGVAVTSNVSVVRSTGNDPNSNPSVVYTVTVARANQDFYQNTFTMVGSLGTGVINFDTRLGLNANVDIPFANGMYLVPSAFNGSSSSYVLTIYFNTATFGTFVSGNVQDPFGTVLFTVS